MDQIFGGLFSSKTLRVRQRPLSKLVFVHRWLFPVRRMSFFLLGTMADEWHLVWAMGRERGRERERERQSIWRIKIRGRERERERHPENNRRERGTRKRKRERERESAEE